MDSTARNWAMACHLSALAMFTCIPFANVIGPLIIWLIKKQEFPFVDDQGKEALNFQITMAIVGLAFFVITIILPFLGLAGILILIFNLVFIIMAAMKASNGEAYRYPVSIRLIK
ncbi:MAG: hypothetical protein AMXMBFR84_12690 [Candidatus Hydrogenedentota bacterium]